MNALLALAKKIRHAPGLRNLEPLWDSLRPAYRCLLDPLGRGVRITLVGRTVRVPAALLSTNPDWSNYERESFTALAGWLDAQSGPVTLLDIGCSFGVVTSFAVQINPRVEVIAFDSDLVSLRALDAVVPGPARARVKRIEGLLGSTHDSRLTFVDAVAATRRRLPDLPPHLAISRSRFVNLNDADIASVPRHRLDTLLAGLLLSGPVLLKCDVEGAELLVLEGAVEFLRRYRPPLLLSVHPPDLPKFGHTTDDVAAFLTAHGYRWRLLARDHEEHWWCEPIAS